MPSDSDLLLAISEAILNNSSSNGGGAPLHHSLRAVLRFITPSLFVSLISSNPLSLPPSSLLSFFHFLSSIPAFRHTPHSLLSMSNHLCLHRLSSSARPLLHLLVSRSGRHSSPSILSTSLSLAPAPHPSLLHVLAATYLHQGLISDALQCIRLTQKYGTPPICTQPSSNLLRHLLRLYPASAAWYFYTAILSYGYPPDIIAFNMIIHAFCKEGRLKDAELVFREISNYRTRPSTASFNTLINGYCRSGDFNSGLQLKMAMIAEGIQPDAFTYSTLLKFLCTIGRLEEADKMLEEMHERGLLPNKIDFTTLMDGYCKAGKVHSSLIIYQEMLKKGIEPDLISVNSLVNGLCKSGDLEEAKRLVEKMNKRGMEPDKFTYTSLIDGHCRAGDLDSAVEIRKKMVEEGIELDNVTHTSLVSGFCRLGRAEDAEIALNDMVRCGNVQCALEWSLQAWTDEECGNAVECNAEHRRHPG